jgi:hypothetical protein
MNEITGDAARMPDEFQQIWKAYDAKLERSLQLNLRLLKDVQTQKMRAELRPLTAAAVVYIVLGILWELLLVLILRLVWSQPVMAVSFIAFLLCGALAIGGYFKDIMVIRQVSYADNIVDTQKKLAALQSSMVRTLRVMWLQLPFWSTFFISNALIRNGGSRFLMIQIPITVLFIIAAIVLYRNITVENWSRKKWVRGLIRGSGFGRVSRAMEHLKEIEDFKRDC